MIVISGFYCKAIINGHTTIAQLLVGNGCMCSWCNELMPKTELSTFPAC